MINLRDDADNFKPKIFFPCLHKAVNILNEQRWHWFHRFFCLRKPDSYTVTINFTSSEFRGNRGLRRGQGWGLGEGRGEGKISAPQ